MPSFTNRGLKRIAIVLLCSYAAVYALGSWLQQLLLYLSVLNVFTSLLAIACWVLGKRAALKPSATERREIGFLLLEGAFAIAAIGRLASQAGHLWLSILQYIVFTVHFIVLLLFLFFVFTFRIKKLF